MDDIHSLVSVQGKGFSMLEGLSESPCPTSHAYFLIPHNFWYDSIISLEFDLI